MDLASLPRTLLGLGINPASLAPLDADESIATLVVPGGKAAVELWETLRAAIEQTGRWPVICGNADEEFAYINGMVQRNDEPPDRIIERVPQDPFAWLIEMEEARVAFTLETFRSRGEPIPDVILAAIEQSRSSTPKPAPGDDEWPKESPGPEVAAHAAFDIADGTPFVRCVMALIPTLRPADVPAYLRFGNFNDCPPPELHVSILREWGTRFGAVPMTVTHDIIECAVSRPPQSPTEARSLAEVQQSYCSDIVSQGLGTAENLAIALWRSPTWKGTDDIFRRLPKESILKAEKP